VSCLKIFTQDTLSAFGIKYTPPPRRVITGSDGALLGGDS